MSQVEEFLVSGAELKCPYGTATCKLKEGKNCTTIRMRDRVFLPIQARKEGENIEGFGMCLSKKCTGGTIPCTARMLLARQWVNPVRLNSVLMIQGEVAIHRNAQLICVSGQASIHALTTGQVGLTENEEKFYKYMEEMFGFDEEIIAIMLKVIYAIDEAYPNESERMKAWRFARLMGGFSYGFGEENKYVEIRNDVWTEKDKRDAEGNIMHEPVNYKAITKNVLQFGITAGFFSADVNYFVNELHLSEEEYYKLRFHVMAQHEITSRPASCYPKYMTDSITDRSSENAAGNVYAEVWIDYFTKFDEEKNFAGDAGEWERLYKKYINISDELDKQLPNQWMLFNEPSKVDSKVEEYIKNLKESNPSINYSMVPNYADFAHQQILTATITLNGLTVDELAGDCVEYIGQEVLTETGLDMQLAQGLVGNLGKKTNDIVRGYRTSLAGWLGDIRLADSKMSEDDYKADLDGLNISNLIIKEDINTIEAINEYYSSLESGTTTREKEFLCNMGDGDASKGYNNIKIQDFFLPNFNLSHILIGKDAGDETFKEFTQRIKEGLE